MAFLLFRKSYEPERSGGKCDDLMAAIIIPNAPGARPSGRWIVARMEHHDLALCAGSSVRNPGTRGSVFASLRADYAHKDLSPKSLPDIPTVPPQSCGNNPC